MRLVSGASSLAVYSDGIAPASHAVASPPANASGRNNTSVTIQLDSTDLRNGASGSLAGWVDQIRYSLAGAQAGEQIAPGHTASWRSRARPTSV